MLEKDITKVNLLKIDVEGHEYSVLEGLINTLKEEKIEIIHFEFNSMNIFSRTFMQDFIDLLKNYCFFRMLPNHLLPLNANNPLLREVFVYQNIVAVHETSTWSY